MREDSDALFIEQFFRTKVRHIALDNASFDGLKEGFIVHQLGPSKVDQGCSLLHESKGFCIKGFLGIWRQRYMDRDVITARKDFLEIVDPLDVAGNAPSCLDGNIRVITQDIHAQTAGIIGNAGPDRT